jgi:hypothetical protein
MHMNQEIKTVELIVFPGLPKIRVSGWPSSSNEDRMLQPGAKVVVQTPKSRELHFYIMVEIIRQADDGRYIGQIIGPEGYQGNRNTICPGETMEFNFDGLKCDDLIYFKDHNVWFRYNHAQIRGRLLREKATLFPYSN